MKYCAHCGAQLVDEAVVCPKCGCAVAPTKTVDPNASPKSRLITLLLCIFVGGLGIHRFYVGKIGTGILWLLTGGCLGIGALVDIIMIATENFTDDTDRLIVQDQRKNPRPAYAYAAQGTTKSARDEALDQLEKLAKLRDSGAITLEEYEQKKADILSKI